MTQILKATDKTDFETIERLAQIIWRHHYEPIIGASQVEYMLDTFQSLSAIESQVESGYEYYIIQYSNESVGYISLKKNEEILFLSKIYVLFEFRGKKIGSVAIQFIINRAKDLACEAIRLTVNKYNSNTIAAYHKLGFKTIESLVIDIGNGYIMDDYKMELSI